MPRKAECNVEFGYNS